MRLCKQTEMKKAILLLFFQIGLGSWLLAQGWEATHQEATDFYQSGKYDRAFELAMQNLVQIRKQVSVESEAYATGLRLLSLVAYTKGLYEQGKDYATQEVNLRKRLAPEGNAAYAEALHNLGLYQLRLGQADKVILALQEALAVKNISFQKEELLRYRLLLAKAYHQHNDPAMAEYWLDKVKKDLAALNEAHFLEAMAAYLDYQLSEGKLDEIRQQKMKSAYVALQQVHIKTQHLPEYAAMLETMAFQYQKVQDFEEARSLYYKLNDLYESKALSDSLRWAGILNNLGAISAKTAPDTAALWLKKSFEIQQQLGNRQDDAFWSSLDNYAMALHREGKTRQSIVLYEQYSASLMTPGESCTAMVVAMNNYAFLLKTTGQRQEALDILKRAYELVGYDVDTVSRKSLLYLTTLCYNLAQAYQSFSQYDSAIYFYKRSTESAKLARATQSAEYLAAINGMAGLYHDIGYYTEAEIFYSEALRIQAQLDGTLSNTYASIQSNYALLHQDRGEYQEAVHLLEEALATKRKLLGLDHPDYIAVLANLGLLYLEQANYSAARRILETVLIKYENLYGKQNPRLASSLTSLARLELAMGNYPEAEPLLKQAIQIKEKLYGNQHPAYAVTAVELGNFYMLLGNYDAAAPLLRKSRTLLKERYGDKHPAYATATQNLAVLSEARGDLTQAEAYLTETLEIDKKTLGKQNPKYALTLNNMASFYQNNDSLTKAMPLLQEALAISQNVLGKEHPLYTSTLLNLALLYQELQEFDRAAPLIDEVVTVRKELLGDKHPDYAYALYGKAVNAYRMEKYEEAVDLFESVTSLYIWQIKEYFPALSEKEKSAFYQRIEPVLNAYRDFVITMNLQDEAITEVDKKGLLCSLYNVQLLTKAMLLDASSKIRKSIFESGNADLITKYEQWQGLKEQLAKYYTLSEQELGAQQINLAALEEEANELEKNLSDQSQIFARSLLDRDLNWRDIQEQLNEEEAAVEIIRVENEVSNQVFYTALVLDINRDAPELVILPDGKEMDTKNYNYYKNAIAFRIEDQLSYDLYWRPIGEVLSSRINRVYVAPDGVYNKISLNCLYNAKKNTFLLDEINLRMLSSTRELTDASQPDISDEVSQFAFLLGYPDYTLVSENALLAEAQQMGNLDTAMPSPAGQLDNVQKKGYDFQPLPGTKDEVDYISEMMKNQDWFVEKLTGSQASEENLKQMTMPYVLHIATHGYFFSDLPSDIDQKAFGIHMQNIDANPLLRSGLLLAGAASQQQEADSASLVLEDGVLTAYEAMNLNLNQTELVVLSACETALGEVKNGEGVYGLQRAFLVAGANSVLMSLWKVNDESTTELIKLFYKNWLAGEDKFTALSNAQRKIRDKYEEPYHWAPFVLIGI